MNTLYKLILAILGLSLVSSCSEDRIHSGLDEGSGQLPIVLSAAYPSLTRASDSGFQNGDRMGVFVLDYINNTPQGVSDEDVHAANIGFRFDETANIWKGSENIFWTSMDTPADIIGYYPFSSEIRDAKAYTFSIQKRQDINSSESEPGGYEASDFLWAKVQKAMPSDTRVDLTFSHIMAGVRVTLVEGSGFSSGEWLSLDKTVSVPNIKPTVNIDLENGSISEASGAKLAVTAYSNGTDWRAVVAPQTVASGANVIDVTIDGVSYHLVKNEDITYSRGKLHSFTITVDKRSDNGTYSLSIKNEAITAWLDDVEFRDGIVRAYQVVNVPKRGGLRESLSKEGISLSSIGSLKLTGEVDEKDFFLMRDEMPALKALNLEDVTVWSENRKNHIPNRALFEKATLSHIVFPKNLEVIESKAFYRTGLMGSLIFPEGLRRIGSDPIEVENYGQLGIINREGVFSGCKNLVGELILPSTLEFIGDAAFNQNNFTGTLHIPESVKEIGNFAFESNNFSGELSIPESVEFIGSGAFARNKFSGNLVIPSSLKSVGAACFQECNFSGTLYIPEGVVTINARAFLGCGFKGELNLPASLRTIGNLAFSETKFSSLILPEKLSNLGEGAFMNCKNLRGSVAIPNNILRLNDYLFCCCPLLTEVIIPKSVIYVGGGAFYGCSALNSLICENPEPPLVSYIDNDRYDVFQWPYSHVGPFYGISMSNFTLEVPKESVNLYKLADGWRDFTRISEQSDFICRPSAVCALNSKHTETLTLNSNGEWEVVEKPDWCTLSKTAGNLKTEVTVTINQLAQGSSDREGQIVFRLKGTDVTTECRVNQYSYQYAEDECITLQKASKGSGIDILFLGDGWNAASIADGSYLNLVNEQMEAFFGVEPFITYRDYFNVYASVCLSQDSGVNTTSSWYNTRFSTFFSYDIIEGEGVLQFDDPDNVFDYAVSHTPLAKERMHQSLIIMTLNSDEYGSATLLTDEGSAIAICCSSPDTYPMDTRGIIQHEACGHAFGKLAEEKVTKNKYISRDESIEIQDRQWRGWYQNISLSGKLSDVQWSHFIYDPRYNTVDIFEGAYGKSRGVFRAEINSCMNYGIPYFNAPSRMDIMRRILDYSGEGFSMDIFYATDSDSWGSTGSTRAALPDASNAYISSGIHHPVTIVKSKKY